MATQRKAPPAESKSVSDSLPDAEDESVYNDSMLCGMLLLSCLFLSALLAILLSGRGSNLQGISFAFPLAYYGIICLLTRDRPALLLTWSGYVILGIVSGTLPQLVWLKLLTLAFAVVSSAATLIALLRGAFPLSRWGKLLALYLQALLLVYHWRLCAFLIM